MSNKYAKKWKALVSADDVKASIEEHLTHCLVTDRSDRKVLTSLMDQFVSAKVENDKLCVTFQYTEYDDEQADVLFRPPLREQPSSAPESYLAVAKVHNGIELESIDHFVPHQVNIRIIEAVFENLGVSLDRCVVNLDRVGNTSAASVPIAFDEAVREDRIKRGDLVLTTAFGSGLTWGWNLIRF